MITFKQRRGIVQKRRLVQQLCTTGVRSYEGAWQLKAFTEKHNAHGHDSVVDGEGEALIWHPTKIFLDCFVIFLSTRH